MGRRRGKNVYRATLARRDYRYLLASLAVSQTGDWLYSVALLVFVFEETRSSAWVAAVTIVRLAPAVLFGPLGGLVADRVDRRRVMIAADVARALSMAALALVAATHRSVLLAAVLAFLTSALGTPFKPALRGLLPAVVDEAHLAAANSLTSTVEHLAVLLGPALGGVLLLLGPVEMSFALNAVSFLASAALIAALRTRTRTRTAGARREVSVAAQLAEGVRAVSGNPGIALVVVFVVAATFVYGIELVVWVLVSERLLGTGSEGVGFIVAAMGLGGLLAAGGTSRLASSRRPHLTLLVIALALGSPLTSLAFVTAPAVAYAVLLVEGAGNIAFDVVTLTLLQRSLPREAVSRVFGLVDSLAVGGVLAGSVLAPVIVGLVGLRATLVLAGLALPVLTLLGQPTLRRIAVLAGRRAAELAPRVAVIDRLRIFDGAGSAALERIAADLLEEHVGTGDVIVREGDAADDFFVIISGTADVLSSGEHGAAAVKVNELGPGDYFGEIGLLERTPRTATVVATSPGVLYRIDGDDFLNAVSLAPAVPPALREGVVGRLARTHPSRRPRSSDES